jgi:hypothetical protein
MPLPPSLGLSKIRMTLLLVGSSVPEIVKLEVFALLKSNVLLSPTAVFAT